MYSESFCDILNTINDITLAIRTVLMAFNIEAWSPAPRASSSVPVQWNMASMGIELSRSAQCIVDVLCCGMPRRVAACGILM